MSIDFGNDGFDYTQDLCSAIERYTGAAAGRRAAAFRYRGMELRYAIERRLYIQAINSPSLFHVYLERQGRPATSAAMGLLTPLEADIAAFFPGAHAMVAAEARQSLLYKMAQRAYGWLRSRRHATAAVGPTTTAPIGNILIHVGNAKFATYLHPVTQRLGQDHYAYLTCNDAQLARTLTQNGHRVFAWSEEVSSLHGVFSSPALADFVQLMHEADHVLAALRAARPAAVLVVEGNAPKDVITAEACRLLGIPCYCVQQGWSPYVHNGFRNMRYTEMFVWGKRFAELLTPFNPDQRFLTTGSHALQQGARQHVDLAQARVFSFFLQAPCALLGVKAFDAFVGLIVAVAKAHPAINFTVREHPGYRLPDDTRQQLNALHNVCFSIPGKELLPDLIRRSELVVSVFSTVLLEAMALHVPSLICSIGSMPRYAPDVASVGAAIEVSTISAARQVIDEVATNSVRLSEIRKNLTQIAQDFFKDGDAAQEIADRLLSHIKT